MYKFDVDQRCSLFFGWLENDQVAGSAYGEESYFEPHRLISIFPLMEIEL